MPSLADFGSGSLKGCNQGVGQGDNHHKAYFTSSLVLAAYMASVLWERSQQDRRLPSEQINKSTQLRCHISSAPIAENHMARTSGSLASNLGSHLRTSWKHSAYSNLVMTAASANTLIEAF